MMPETGCSSNRRNRTSPWKAAGVWFALSAVYLGLAAAMTWPLIARLAYGMPGGHGDPLLSCWYLQHNIDALCDFSFRSFYQGNILYPSRDVVAFSEPFIATTLLALPLYLLAGCDIVVTYNLLLIVSFALSGLSMHVLVYSMTRSHKAALLGGIVFAFAPARFAQVEHLHLVTAYWMALVLWASGRFMRRRDLLSAFLAALFFVLNALTSMFYMVALSVLLCVWGLLHSRVFLRCWREIVPRMLVAAAAAVVCILAVLGPYVSAHSKMGLKRTLSQNAAYAATPLNYLGVPSWQGRNLIYGRGFGWERFSQGEAALFTGLVPVFLAASLVREFRPGRRRRIRRWLPWLAVTAAGFLLSMGPEIQVGNMKLSNVFFRLFFELFPGFSSMRASSRFSVLVLMGISVLSGIALARLHRTVLVSRAGWLLLPLCLLEYISAPLGQESRVDPGGRLPDAYVWLQKNGGGAPVFEMPADSFWDNARYTFFAGQHRIPVVNGYSSYYPPFFRNLTRMPGMTADKLELLGLLGVRYITVHQDAVSPHWREARKAMADLDVVKVFDGDIKVFEVPPVEGAKPDWSWSDIAGMCTFHLPGSASSRASSVNGQLIVSAPYPARLIEDVIFSESAPLTVSYDRRFGFSRCRVGIGHFRADQEDAVYRLSMPMPSGEGKYAGKIMSGKDVLAQFAVTVSGLPVSTKPGGELRGALTFGADSTYDLSSEALIRVEVRNDGDTMWIADSQQDRGRGAVRLGYRLFAGESVVGEGRTPLPYDLGPNESVKLDVKVSGVTAAAADTLEIGMVAEGMSWFSTERWQIKAGERGLLIER